MTRPPPRRLLEEYYNSTNGTTYRTYADGSVVTYGLVGPPDRATTWRAAHWTAHPLLAPHRARRVGYLCVDATWDELRAALAAWEHPPTEELNP